jgi:hypothetical protein
MPEIKPAAIQDGKVVSRLASRLLLSYQRVRFQLTALGPINVAPAKR